MIANIAIFLLDLLSPVFLYVIAIMLILYAWPNNLELGIVRIVDFGFGVKVSLLSKVAIIWFSAAFLILWDMNFFYHKWNRLNLNFGIITGSTFMILLPISIQCKIMKWLIIFQQLKSNVWLKYKRNWIKINYKIKNRWFLSAWERDTVWKMEWIVMLLW